MKRTLLGHTWRVILSHSTLDLYPDGLEPSSEAQVFTTLAVNTSVYLWLTVDQQEAPVGKHS